MSDVAVPVRWVEEVSRLRLPAGSVCRMQDLMDRHNEGALTVGEREELDSLVELTERLSLVRTEALHLLGRGPTDASDVRE